MMVRNESAVIERCLNSAKSQIDSWVIVDTGSTDDTCERIERTMGSIPGRLEHRPFVDFGHNRTQLMELAYEEGVDWLLLLDADMVLEVEGELHELLSQVENLEILLLEEIGGDTEMPMPHLLQGRRHWKFEGVTYEVLTTAGRPRPGRLAAARVHDHADGWSRGHRDERDRRLLEAEHERRPDDPRTLFYLAQTYRDLGYMEDALRCYSERVELDSPEAWDEETFYAQYQIGLLQIDHDWAAAVDALLRAWSMRPTRAEPLFHLAYGWRNREAWPVAYLFASRGVYIPEPDDILYVDTPLYRWGLRFERSVAAWYVGERELARADSEELLADPELPEHWRAFAQDNLRLSGGQP
jgi:tetratricopeptide (TPR) repeat protein